MAAPRRPDPSEYVAVRFGRSGRPVMIHRDTVAAAKRIGARLYEDGSMGPGADTRSEAAGIRRARPPAPRVKAPGIFQPHATLDPSAVRDIRADTRSEKAGVRGVPTPKWRTPRGKVVDDVTDSRTNKPRTPTYRSLAPKAKPIAAAKPAKLPAVDRRKPRAS